MRQEDITREIDLRNETVERAKQNLSVAVEESGAVVTSGQLPVIKAYEGHLTALFQNLIGNAVKYRSEETPRIHIAVQEVDSMCPVRGGRQRDWDCAGVSSEGVCGILNDCMAGRFQEPALAWPFVRG